MTLIVFKYHIFFWCSFVDWHLNYFRILTTVISAIMDVMLVHSCSIWTSPMLLYGIWTQSFGCIPGELCWFQLHEEIHSYLHIMAAYFIFPTVRNKGSFFIFLPVLFDFQIKVILTEMDSLCRTFKKYFEHVYLSLFLRAVWFICMFIFEN